jgi:hypothetical protein
MPLEGLWAQFFQPAYAHLYNIYLHPSPSYTCRPSPATPDHPFNGKCLPPHLRVHTAWGSPALVAAARNMLAYAVLDDPKNQYFALLSESCIPLWPLRHVHAFLVTVNSTFMAHGDAPRGEMPEDSFAAKTFDRDEFLMGSQCESVCAPQPRRGSDTGTVRRRVRVQ